MVGGLVEQQKVWVADQAASEDDAALHPGGESLESCIAVKFHQRDGLLNLIGTLPVMFIIGKIGIDQARSNDIFDAPFQVLRHFLREIRRADVLLAGNDPIVRHEVIVEHLQQRGLAHAIASQQTDTLAAFDLKTNAFQ